MKERILRTRCLAMSLTLTLVCTLLPTSALAAETLAQGQYTSNQTWYLQDDGSLVIQGTGTLEQGLSDLWEDGLVRAVVLDEGMTGLGSYALSSRSDLYRITLPDSLTEIGSGAFRNCTGLLQVDIPAGVKTIGREAFAGCSGITSIAIPEGVTEVADSTFWYCTALTQVTLPSTLTSIGTGAFGHTALTSIEIPAGVTSIGGSAFMDCTELTSVVIPEGVTVIPEYTFAGCTSLSQVVIPESVTEIEFNAFFQCPALTDPIIPSSVTTIGDHAFGYDKNDYGLTRNRTLTIYGYSGSAAEEYAEKNRISFIALDTGASALPLEDSDEPELYANALWSEDNLDDDLDISQTAASSGFSDVSATAYYAEAVAWAVENGITSGTSTNTFSPENSCTRGQIVTFLWRAKGSPTPATTVNPFTDVSPSDYYYNAVLWAYENGITTGTSDTTFGPNQSCTRGQAVTFLWRTENKPASVDSGAFFDVEEDGYYRAAVAWAVAKGVTSGTSKTTFSPDDTCTRGQIVTFLYRNHTFS